MTKSRALGPIQQEPYPRATSALGRLCRLLLYNQNLETVHEAKYLVNKIPKKENIILTDIWITILVQINDVSESLQNETLS